MDNELRDKIRTAISDAWCDKGKDQTFGKFLDDSADAIDALYQAHYAEMAEKEGLELRDSEIWDVSQKVYKSNKHKALPDGSMQILEINAIVDAELVKVMPWHEAKVAEAVKETQKSIANVLMNSIALEFTMEPEIVTIRLPIKYIESLKGGK
jgi:hypothetical protein